LLDRVDPNQLLDRVDPDRLLARVDTNQLIARTDLNAALNQVDFDEVLDRVDVKKVVERAGVPELVSQSTGHMAGSALDLVRRQLVAVDQIIMQITMKMVRRDPETLPAGPPDLVAEEDPSNVRQITGHYAGPLSRLVAFMIDVAVVFGMFTLFSAGILFVFSDLLGRTEVAISTQTGVGLLLFISWAFSYGVISLAVAGRTVGKWIVGERVVAKSGQPVHLGQAIRRVVTMPLSFLFLGLGFIGLLFGRQRRALHDILGGTVVVYDWGDRPAEMSAPLARWISDRKGVDLPPPAFNS
jgi:uncharacterized RDD family membrane protein YckC